MMRERHPGTAIQIHSCSTQRFFRRSLVGFGLLICFGVTGIVNGVQAQQLGPVTESSASAKSSRLRIEGAVKNRVIHLHPAGASEEGALEIIQIELAGKAITLGQPFEADENWLKELRIKFRNVSNKPITHFNFGGGLIRGLEQELGIFESYQEGIAWDFGKQFDPQSDEEKQKSIALQPGEVVELAYENVASYYKRTDEIGAFCKLVLGPTGIQFADGTTDANGKIRFVDKTSMATRKNTPPSKQSARCQYWQSKVDETLASPLEQAIDERDPQNILEAVGCLLQMEGNKHPARFSGATQLYVSELFEPATSEIGALYYISYLYTQKWSHADAIALQGDDGAINSPQDIEIAYQSYRRWFEQVKAVGIVKARQMNLQPLKDTNVEWY